MSASDDLTSRLGAKVTDNQSHTVYPPIPPSLSPSEESSPDADMAPIYVLSGMKRFVC